MMAIIVLSVSPKPRDTPDHIRQARALCGELFSAISFSMCVLLCELAGPSDLVVVAAD